ncbi:unnamed protein product [Rotaria sp. Silwood1]|nr:unnamed protein product [Rotaria sp. Silwood1]
MNFRNFFSSLHLHIVSYADTSDSYHSYSNSHIIICTIEKANSIINYFLSNCDDLNEIGIIIVDELYWIDELNHGYSLELLLSKIIYYNYLKITTNNSVKIIDMSATIPNLNQLAQWFDIEPVGLDSELACLIPMGIAFHHAGLTIDKRELIENAYRVNVICVIPTGAVEKHVAHIVGVNAMVVYKKKKKRTASLPIEERQYEEKLDVSRYARFFLVLILNDLLSEKAAQQLADEHMDQIRRDQYCIFVLGRSPFYKCKSNT